MNKYGAKKTEYNGQIFDSKKEANRAWELDILKRTGEVREWWPQVPFELQPSFTYNNKKNSAIKYYADFVVEYYDGSKEIEDVKSSATKTPLYKLKKKMLLYQYGIPIKEIY